MSMEVVCKNYAWNIIKAKTVLCVLVWNVYRHVKDDVASNGDRGKSNRFVDTKLLLVKMTTA